MLNQRITERLLIDSATSLSATTATVSLASSPLQTDATSTSVLTQHSSSTQPRVRTTERDLRRLDSDPSTETPPGGTTPPGAAPPENPPQNNPAPIVEPVPDTPAPEVPGTVPPGDNTLETANLAGVLSSKLSFTDSVDSSDPVDYYRFEMATSDVVSVFLNGLSAGYTIELLDSSGAALQSATNSGTTWTPTDSGTPGGSLTTVLEAGTYYVRVTPADLTGNPLYALAGSYTVNLQPHNAPNTVTVAASNSALADTADYVATGVSDQDIIEQAIAAIAAQGGGTVLLLEGTYNISDNLEILYDNITLSGVGWGSHLRLVDGAQLEDAGLLRSAYHTVEENIADPYFSNQHFLHLSLDGNKSGGTSYTNSYANFGTYVDSSFQDIRAHDFPHYGFDPHENSDAGQPTLRLTMIGNLADHNDVDGLTIDNCIDSVFINNILDSNGRHGINIVTAAENNIVQNNWATNNGGNGIVIQPGTETERTSDSNQLIGNIVQFNQLSGILVQLADSTIVTGNTVTNNAQHGIRLRGATSSTISDNILDDNAQAAVNQYYGVYVDDYVNTSTGEFAASTNNLIQNNSIQSATTSYRNGIRERSVETDFNTYAGNVIAGTIREAIFLLGPNSQQIS